MKIHPTTYMVILHGRVVATASYLQGMLCTLHITTDTASDVVEMMVVLPAREKNISHTEGIGMVPLENLIVS